MPISPRFSLARYRVSRVLKPLFTTPSGQTVVIAILSLLISAFALLVAKRSLDSSERVEQAAALREERAKLLFLAGVPEDNGAAIRIRASDPSTIFRSMTVKLEYARHVSKFEMPPASDVFTMEYVRPYLQRRVDNLQKSDHYKEITKNLVAPGIGELDASVPVLIHTHYVLAGNLLEDLSLYKVAFRASWSLSEPKPKLRFTGMSFCARVPLAEKATWLADDHVFVGTDYSGGIDGPVTFRIVNC